MTTAVVHQDSGMQQARRGLRAFLFIVAALLFIPFMSSAASLGTWPRINVGSPAKLFITGIAYGNGTWVVVGQGGFISTSMDTKIWTKRSAGITRDFNDVTFSSGRFIAVCKAPDGDTGLGEKIWISDDNGATWTSRKADTGTNVNNYITVGLHGVASDGSGNLVAVSGYPGRITRSSDNGNTWHAWTNSLWNTLYGVGYGKGMWIATGNGNGIYRSADGGASWTTVSTSMGGTHVAYGNGRFLLADNYNGKLRWSSDGATWNLATTTNGASSTFTYVKGCVFFDGLFVAATEYGDIWTSETGRQFKQWRAAGGDPDAWCVGGGGGTYIAGGGDFSLNYGTAWISPSWLRARTGSTRDYPYTVFDAEEGLPKKIGLPEYRVNTASLNLVLEATLFYMQTLSSPVDMHLVYNSAPTTNGASSIGIFGKNWRFRYESVIGAFGSEAQVMSGGGRSHIYTTTNGLDLSTATLSSPIKLTPPAGVFDELKFYGTGNYFELREKSSKLTYRYAVSGGAGNSIWRMTRITDRSGNQINLAVDGASGRISSITDPAGRVVTLTYDTGKNLCTGITAPDGRSVSFSYDTAKNLTGITDMAGYVGSYTYDTNGFLLTMNTAGRVNTFTYKDRPGFESGSSDPENAGDKVVSSVINMAGLTTKYELLTNNAGMKRTDTKGGITIFTSTEGQTAKVTDPLGKISQMEYSTAKMPESFTDPNGKITTFDYDDRGNLISTKDALGNQTTMSYDSRDNLISRVNALGKTAAYAYDGNDRVTSVQTPLGSITRLTYLSNGRTSTILDARTNTTTFAYDTYGNTIRITDPLTNSTQFAYSAQGLRCTSMTDPRGKIKSMQYDNNDRLTTVRYDSASGTPQRVNTFDAFGQTSLTDELGQITSVTRNEFGYITSVIDPLGNGTATEYDPNNNPVKVTDPLGFVTTTTYDSANRPLVLTDATGKTVKREYDADGNLLSLTDQNNNKTTFKYDANNRLIGATDPLLKTMTFNLDALGRVLTTVNGRGQIIRYTYDDDGRVTKKEYNETVGSGVFAQEAALTYDANGNILSRVDDWGTTRFTYDARNKPVTIVYPTSKTVSFTYTAAGRLASITYPNGLVVNYTYDDYNRLAIPAILRNAAGTELQGNSERPNNITRLVMTLGGKTNAMDYAYDKAGNRLSDTRTNNTSTTYAYDSAQRVTNILHKAGTNTLLQFGLAYNKAGSMTKETSTGSAQMDPEMPAADVTAYNGCNQVTSRAGKVYAYDADGNLTVISGGDFSATYTPENRPSQITRKRDAVTETIQYTYDANGMRVKRVVVGGVTNQFHYGPADQLLFTTDGAGNVTASYVWKGSMLVAVITGGSLSTDVSYPHLNRAGNVMALTGSNGMPTVKYAYQPYGFAYRETVPAGGTDSNLLTFAGGLGVQDEGGGLFYMKNRFYDANTGRFLQKDPIGFSGGINLYAYARANPVNLFDPSGLLGSSDAQFDRFAEAVNNSISSMSTEDRAKWDKGINVVVDSTVNWAPGGNFIQAGRELYKGNPGAALENTVYGVASVVFPEVNLAINVLGQAQIFGLPTITDTVNESAKMLEDSKFGQGAAAANDPMNWLPAEWNMR